MALPTPTSPGAGGEDGLGAPETCPCSGFRLEVPVWKGAGVWKPWTGEVWSPGSGDAILHIKSCQSCSGNLSSGGGDWLCPCSAQRAELPAASRALSFLPSFPQCSVPEEPGARGRVRSAARHRALVVASEPAPAGHWGQLQASWPSRGFCCREHSSAGRRAEGFTELFVSPPGQGGSQEAGGRALPDRRGASACPGRIRGGQLG